MSATSPKMNRLNIGELAETVQTNCHISDARYAGNYSMCIFLLKMREYYRWENDIPLSKNLSKDDVGPWLLEREQIWDDYEPLDYQPLTLSCGEFDPFDNEAINQQLNPLGYVYSSGYGVFNKPHFFLARLKQKFERDGTSFLVSDCEYARDMVAPPAMLLDKTVYIRHESIRRMIWEQIDAWQWKKNEDTALCRALKCYEPIDDMEALLDELCTNETHNVILHELGEAQASKILGPEWETMLSEMSRSKAELQIRAVRDHLADCLTTLPAIIKSDNEASLHFYFANFTAMRKEIFPQAYEAYQTWVTSKQAHHLTELILQSEQHWKTTALQILDLFSNKQDDFNKQVDILVSSPISA